MAIVTTQSNYWMSPSALTFTLNALEDPDYNQVTVLGGSVIMAFVQGVIDYDASRNYRKWTLEAFNSYFETVDAKYVYARLEKVGTKALVVYADEEVELSSGDYYYIYLGKISASANSGGTKVDRYWEDVLKTGILNTNQFANEETGAEWRQMFRWNKVTDLIEVLKTFSSFVVNKFFLRDKEINDIKRSTDSDKDVPVSDTSLVTSKYVGERFLSKLFDDISEGLITFLKGLKIGKDFVPGFTGVGGFFDQYANGEIESLFIRRKLVVPEIIFNSVEVSLGDKWRAPGGGVIKSIDMNTRTVDLDLQDGQIGAVAVNDICMGIFHSLEPTINATEDMDDSCGNRTYAGFYTAYFLITEVVGDRNQQFKYNLRPISERWKHSYHPSEMMHFVVYGNVSNKDRQTSVYETRTYTRMLWKQTTFEISAANIAQQTGDLSNMTVHGKTMTGYSAYLDSIYMTGAIHQIKPDGTTAPLPNYLPNWKSGDEVNFYDEVSHEGGVWLCINEDGTKTIPDKDNPDWVIMVAPGKDGDDGTGITSAPAWNTEGTPYAKNTILSFAGKVFISNKETSEAPYPLVTNENGSRLLQKQKGDATWGYIIHEYVQSEDWDLLLDPTAILKGVKETDVLYAVSTSQTVAPTVGWQTTAPDWETGKFIWSKTRTVYTDNSETESEPFCLPTGIDGIGIQSIVEEYYLSSSPQILAGGSWTENRPDWKNGWYYWTRSVITYTDGTSKTTTEICVSGEKGKDGDSVSLIGDWSTGLRVPYLGMVRMGGATWICKNMDGTINPPLWTMTDKDGNRILQTQDGGKTLRYILTGERNTDEYELSAENGENGVGIRSMIEEYYRSSSATLLVDGSWSTTRPSSASGWYIWARSVITYTDGNITRTEGVCVTGDSGKDGIPGCLMIKSEWGLNNEYRNDEALTSGTRYINIALVRDNSLQTGWQAYKCLKTHTSTTANAPGNAEYWEAFGLNVNAIFTSLIIAKDAILEFVQGNQFLIKDSQGNVTGGFDGEGYFWMGGPSPNNAKNVIRAIGSGHLADGNIFWDENGNVEMAGDFIGKVTTRKNGVRMVLDPASNSFIMYNANNMEIIKIAFMGDGTMAGLRLRNYSGTTITSEQSLIGTTLNQFIAGSAGNGYIDLHTYLDPSNGLRFFENSTMTKQYARK